MKTCGAGDLFPVDHCVRLCDQNRKSDQGRECVNNQGAAETKAELTTKARRHEYDWEKKQNEPLFLFRVFVSSG